MIDAEDEYDHAAHHAAWLAQTRAWEAHYQRRMARLAELDAVIARAERNIQHYEAIAARANGRVTWFRKFMPIARRAAFRRFIAAASRTLAAKRYAARTRKFRRGEITPTRRMVFASRASGDDPAAAPIPNTVAEVTRLPGKSGDAFGGAR
jgi:hypothetical protein